MAGVVAAGGDDGCVETFGTLIAACAQEKCNELRNEEGGHPRRPGLDPFHRRRLRGQAAEQSSFPTPLQAVDALAAAAKNEDNAALLAIFGSDADDLLHTGDPVQDRQALERFRGRMDEKIALVRQDVALIGLELGKDDWPFAIPLRQGETGWYFDTEAGRQEIISRRIGENELHTLGVVRAYVDAQYEYARQDADGDGRRNYAERLLSSPGKKDGLYWPVAEGEAESPMGPLVAEASEEGYQKGGGGSYHGYRYKILKAQGPSAPGGERSYTKDGAMTGGFALVAYPAEYGTSGIMTFMVNQQDIVFQKDLGAETASIAANIASYDPDESWMPTADAFRQTDHVAIDPNAGNGADPQNDTVRQHGFHIMREVDHGQEGKKN